MRSWLHRHHRPARTGLAAVAVLVVLALVAGATAVWAVRRAFPEHDGELTLPGLSAPVTVHRDEYGIPHIYAETETDLFRAQGFVHAQDRFWEMDLRRHITSGRLAEWFGESEVDTDRFLRTLGWRRVAAEEWREVSPQAARYLFAYAEGVNAWIDETSGPAATWRKALQYQVLGLRNPGYEVEPWTPVDTLAWLKAMAWDLRTNLVDETERARLLAAGLTRSEVEALFPEYPYREHDPIVSGGGRGGGGRDGGRGGGLAAEPRAPAPAGLGSNSWVVGGEHTATGAPILVNDPHLGVSMPGIWYQVGLHCACGYRVSGFSFSGVPGVVIGHNDRIAWGFTNLGADVTDLHLERVEGDRYQVDGQWRRLETREERIEVAGGEDVLVEVRATRHGPLLSDVDARLRELAADRAVISEAGGDPDAGGYAVSLAWTALRAGDTIEALFVLNQARDWEDFREAASRFDVPAQNLTYADVDGNIGYQAPGLMPVRGTGDGTWPAPGWDPAYDWDGWIPFEELPSVFNPPDGTIVTANQAVTGPRYPHLLTRDWSYGYRSDRIQEMLAAAPGPVTVSDMERMLSDDADGFAPTLVPALLAAPSPPRGRDEQAALDLLRDWDFRQAEDSAAAAYYQAVWRQLLALTFDELPPDLRPRGGDRWFRVVGDLLDDPGSPWWDDRGTGPTETRDDLLARALAAGYLEVAIAQGDDPRGWRWGAMHTLPLRDATFGSSGIGPVEALFNRGPVPAAGGTDAVNATSWDTSAGYEVVAAPSMRMIVDLSDLDGSRWVQLTGNSGHPYHPNYADQVELWRTGDMLAWPWRRSTVEATATATLILSPG